MARGNRGRLPLSWGFAAHREGFEPPTARSVGWAHPANPSGLIAFPLLALSVPSIWMAPVAPPSERRGDQRDDQEAQVDRVVEDD